MAHSCDDRLRTTSVPDTDGARIDQDDAGDAIAVRGPAQAGPQQRSSEGSAGSRRIEPEPGASAKEVWTAEETARYLRVPVATMYRWRYLRVGPPAHRVGKHLRYVGSEVRRWVCAQ